MELTKQQIQFIDHRLENEGIKYWDIRIEMLDHAVSEVETKITPETTEYEFKELVQDAFENLGWKENFNGGGLDAVFLRMLKNYSKKNNKEIGLFYKKTFLKAKSIILIFIFWLYLFAFQNNSLIIKFTMAFTLILLVVAFIGFVLKYEVFKSAKLNSLLFLISLPISIFNVFMFWPKMFFGIDKLSSLYTVLIFAIIIPFFIIGINFLFIEFKKAKNTYNQLIY